MVRRLSTPKERAETDSLAVDSLSEVIERLREENDRLQRRDQQKEELVGSLQTQLRDCLAARRAARQVEPPEQREPGPWS